MFRAALPPVSISYVKGLAATVSSGLMLKLYCNLASWGVVWYGKPGKAAPAAVAAAAAAAGSPAAPGKVAYVYGAT